MTVFPQLGTGAISQFPVVKRRRMRTVVNRAADGTAIKLADPGGGFTEWVLQYKGLSDAEIASLQQFFTDVQGGLNGFTFVDPNGNLLARTEELNDAVWQGDRLLTLTGDVADPMSGTGGWHAVNGGQADQGLLQTLNAPAGYTYCFSIYVKAVHTIGVTLVAAGQRAARMAGNGWMRLAFTAIGDSSADSVAFGVELPAGCSVDLFGPQVDAQPAPSTYKRGVTGGVYEGARFRDHEFSYTTTDPNRHSTTVRIFYADHL
jgi:hypothetical protein